jgi:ribosomal protein S18 acetylase RimI-like enzyme
VRRYQPGDRQAVWDLHNLALHDAQAHGGNGPWDADLRAIESSYLDEGGEFLVGTIGRRVVAMGALRRVSVERAAITRTRVHPAFQRRGFARRILHELERTATRLGYSGLMLDTTVEQTAAQALYRAAGYRETGRGTLGRFEVIYFAKSLPA